jgi:uncharacterized protein YbbC (DUF1343 family)
MKNWWRNSLFSETGLPWVMPSPNMPGLETALVYAGMVLLEATNLSEGRGTTRPFELFGAPFIDPGRFEEAFGEADASGCVLREHGFIPTFNKHQGEFCNGWQLHVTDARAYRPVYTAAAVLRASLAASSGGFRFSDPPYEYEMQKVPFDILAGDSSMRKWLEERGRFAELRQNWEEQHRGFQEVLNGVALYPEERS